MHQALHTSAERKGSELLKDIALEEGRLLEAMNSYGTAPTPAPGQPPARGPGSMYQAPQPYQGGPHYAMPPTSGYHGAPRYSAPQYPVRAPPMLPVPRAPIRPPTLKPPPGALIGSPQVKEKPHTTVYVGKISPLVDDEFLNKVFELCGPVKSWKRAQDPSTGKPKGFGFCEFGTAEGVLRALRILSNFCLEDQELVVNVNQATREYLDRYTQIKNEYRRKQAQEQAQEEKDPDDDKDGSAESAETADVEKQESSTDAAERTEEDEKEIDEKALATIRSLLEARQKSRPPPPPPSPIAKASPVPTEVGKGADSSHVGSRGGEASVRETEISKPGEDDAADSAADRPRPTRREANEERLERERERERERARARRDRERETRVLEMERAYELQEREWEAREKEKDRERAREREKEREKDRERRHLVKDEEESDCDDERSRAYRRVFADEAKKRRRREREEDELDRLTEEREMREAKRLRLLEAAERRERLPSPKAELPPSPAPAPKLPVTSEPPPVKPKLPPVTSDSPPVKPEPPALRPTRASEPSPVKREPSEPPPPSPPAKRTALPKPFRAAAPSVFGEVEEEEGHEYKKRRFVPLDYSAEEMAPPAPSPTPLPPPPTSTNSPPATGLAGAAEFAKSLSTAVKPREERRQQRERRSSRDRPPSRGGDGGEVDAKSLIDSIPKTKEELFAHPIDWKVFDLEKVGDRMRPWISKKITEFLGEEETTLVDFIVQTTYKHEPAAKLLELLETLLDEEAEMFVLKMWRMLIFETKRAELGLKKGRS